MNAQASHLQVQTGLHSVYRRSAQGASSGPELSGCSGNPARKLKYYIMLLLPFWINKVLSHLTCSDVRKNKNNDCEPHKVNQRRSCISF